MQNRFIEKIRDYIEERFYVGPKGIIGIDIGISAIKFAEMVETNEGYKLNRFAIVDLPEAAIIEDEIHKEDDILKALQKGIKELDSSNKFVAISVSGPNTVIKKLQLPGGTMEEIEDNVMWEIEQYLPYSIDEANVSFSILGENQGGGVDVITGSAKKTLVNSFKELVERLNLKVKIVDLGIAAAMNVFEYTQENEISENGSVWIFLDIGGQKTELIIYKNGVMIFSKEISMGGLTITEEIQRQMGVNYQEAESLKVDGDGNGSFPEEIVEIINQVLDSFFTEIKKTIDFWISSTSEEKFAGCYITGGSSVINGLNDALQEVLDTEVHILNPFNRIAFNTKNIDESLIDIIASRGVVAMGLAMRKIEK